MSQVQKTVETQKQKCERQAYAYLRKAAEESVFYVALGRVLKRDMAERFGLLEDEVGGLLSKAAVELVDKIRAL